MVRFAVTGAVAALLALSGCGGASPEREKKEQEATAAEKKLADSRVFLEQLEREKKLLATKLAESTAQLAESHGRLYRTLAGAAYLAVEKDNGGLVLDVDMAAARDGFLLEESARAKDLEAISELGARVLDDQRPCVRTAAAAGDEETGACPPCEVAPFEDTCIGVEKNRSSSPDWSCATLARTGEGLPPTAFCTSVFQHPAPEGSVMSDYAERDLDTSLQVVRVAFAHNGQLHVSDYPPPELSLYNPPNVGPLAQCGVETARNKCIHECQVSHGRYEDPCACEEPSPEPPAEEERPEYAEGEGESYEEPEEPEEVREGRAIAEAEEAAYAEEQYQQCLRACEGGDDIEVDDPEVVPPPGEVPPPEPTSSVVNVSLESTPAPGIFVVSRELKVLGARQEVVESSRLTLVLSHPGLVALWQKKAPPEGALGKLEEVGQLDTVALDGGKAALVSLPGVEGSALVGLLAGKVTAYAFHTKPGQEPVVTLAPAAVCEAVRAEPKRFPQGVQDACAKLGVSAAPAAVDAGTPEGPVDAGAPERPTDAGSGEVAP
ncbi:MAG TPA: hypothetical protein VF815_15055 [Myxococcaceae bacterium]|jgi:hypothetical protein